MQQEDFTKYPLGPMFDGNGDPILDENGKQQMIAECSYCGKRGIAAENLGQPAYIHNRLRIPKGEKIETTLTICPR